MKKIHLLSFFIPAILMTLAFRTIDIFPFGENQILVIDAWHQYYPFLQELQEILQTPGRSLMNTWNAGHGTNFITLLAYYGASPLNLLSVIVPYEYLREFMAGVTILKISLAGLTFSIYLRGINKKEKPSKLILGFSVLYALCAYVTGYYWCIFFLDAIYLLPLVILGLYKFIKDGKFKLYTISLALCIFSNYYMSIFICLFVILYHFVIYFTESKDKFDVIHFFKKSFQVLGLSLLGVILASTILVPVILWTSNTGSTISSFTKEIATYNTIPETLSALLTGNDPTVVHMTGLPNIACGVICIVLAGFYFINNKVSVKERIIYAGLLVFFIFSFNVNILDFAWHFGHFPNGIPYRQAFLLSFVLLTVASKAQFNTPVKNMIKVFIFIALSIVLLEQVMKESIIISGISHYVSLIFLIGYAILIFLMLNNKKGVNVILTLLILCMCGEAYMSAVLGVQAAHFSNRNTYMEGKDDLSVIVDTIYEHDSEFFRMEMANPYSANDSILYGFRGISQFSSTSNLQFTKSLEMLGLKAHPYGNKYSYNSSTPINNLLLNLRYILTRENHNYLNSNMFTQYFGEENIMMSYINKYWLPVGFIMNSEVKNIGIEIETNPFRFQENLISKATGIENSIYNYITPDSITEGLEDLTKLEDGKYSYSYGSARTITATFYPEVIDKQMYIYIKNPWNDENKTATVEIVDREGTVYLKAVRAEAENGVIIDAGRLSEEKYGVRVSFQVASHYGYFYLIAATLNEEDFVEHYNILGENTMSVVDFSDTSITGSIKTDKSGTLFLSVPYDKGWSIRVNGEKRKFNTDSYIKDKINFIDGFLSVDLEEGYYNIELEYRTHGLNQGITLTILGMLIFSGLVLFEYTKKRRYRNNEK